MTEEDSNKNKHEEFSKKMEERIAARDAQKKEAQLNPNVINKNIWNQSSTELKTLINNLLENPPSEQDKVTAWAKEIKDHLSRLQDTLNQYSYVLSPFDIESSLKEIQKLQTQVQSKQDELAPAKKFSFKSKKPKAEESPQSQSIKLEQQQQQQQQQQSQQQPSIPLTLEYFPGVFDTKEQKIVKFEAENNCTNPNQNQLPKGKEEFAISRCEKSKIYLCHPMGALRIQKLSDCIVSVGPVKGAIYVIDCQRCIFQLFSHQVRIHECVDCDFYLSVASSPIIEHCSALRFAPYSLTYPLLESHMKDLEWIDQIEGKWTDVKDFNWLRSTQSPNWSVLPDEKRLKLDPSKEEQ